MSAGTTTPPKDVATTTEGCRFCWMCRQACPVGLVTCSETYTPHGWALTVESVRRGTLAWNAETVDVMYTCADCGLCQAHCKTDRPLPDAIALARTEIVAAGKAPAAVMEIDRQLKANGTSYPAPAAAAVPGKGERVLFVGDAAQHLRPAAVQAAQALLKAAGVVAAPIGASRSTGLVASSLGLKDTAAALARAVVDDVKASGCREVLVLSPGDRFAFEHVYPERLGMTWPEGVVIRDVTAVLAQALSTGALKVAPVANAEPYAYHDPCHTARLTRDTAAPRALAAAALGAANARELFWREGRAHPCGATGGLDAVQPKVAGELADARLADAGAAGASVLVTEDPACVTHLASRPGTLKVVSLFELLAAQLAG